MMSFEEDDEFTQFRDLMDELHDRCIRIERARRDLEAEKLAHADTKAALDTTADTAKKLAVECIRLAGMLVESSMKRSLKDRIRYRARAFAVRASETIVTVLEGIALR